jgi:hypothetical protein
MRKNDFYSIADTWNLYIQLDYMRKVKKKIYNEIIRDFTEFLAEELLDNGIIFFPENVGHIKIEGEKKLPKKIEVNGEERYAGAVNWKATNELWNSNPEVKEKKQLIFHLNEDTGYVRYKIMWSKAKSVMKFKDVCAFIPCRHLKRKTSNLIQRGKEYLIITNKTRKGL